MFLFITRFFAFIGFMIVLLIGLGIAAAMHFANRPAAEPASVILTLDFDQSIIDNNSSSPLSLALHEEHTTLLDILRAIDKAKIDPHVKGIYARFGGHQPKLAEAEEIREALRDFRDGGKFTYAFAPSYGDFGGGNRTYYLASAFENIWLQPVGAVALSGIALQEPFGKTALDKIGVKADFMQREEYKSFMDMATRDDFAPPVRANMQSLIDDLATQIATGIADSRGFDVPHVRDLMAKGPFTDQEALREKLITRLGYADELSEELEAKAGKDVKKVNVATYLSYGAPIKAPAQKKFALIYGSGMILDHDDGASSVTGEKVMGADTIAEAFDTAADDANVKGIMFRIDSPGGTPEASETIRRAMIHAQKSGKPVFVSMGDTAASGGYWIAMNADRIVAEASTITGSIGVLAGKFAFGDMLQKLGISVGTIKTADSAGMLSMAEGFTPAQRERMNALLDNSYKAFTDNVAAARHIPLEKMPDLAKGRVWTGSQAAQNGLVDELGGFAKTLFALRHKLNMADSEQVELVVYPPPETPLESILKMMKSLGAEEAALRPLLLGASHVQAVLAGLPKDVQTAQSPITADSVH